MVKAVLSTWGGTANHSNRMMLALGLTQISREGGNRCTKIFSASQLSPLRRDPKRRCGFTMPLAVIRSPFFPPPIFMSFAPVDLPYFHTLPCSLLPLSPSSSAFLSPSSLFDAWARPAMSAHHGTPSATMNVKRKKSWAKHV